MDIIRPIIFTLSSALILGGCKAPQTEAPTQTADKIVDESAIPHGTLGTNIAPIEYRLDMVMNPDDAGFKGVVEIDAKLVGPTQKIWLHGKDMTVTGASAKVPGGDTIPLEYHAVPETEAPSGVAYLSSEKPIPAGALTLHIPYETPYNLHLNSAYKVERGNDAYIVTQFEPLGAREAFPSFDESRFKVPFTLSITAPADDFVYANTPETMATTLDNGWVKHDFAKTRPLPTYLIAFGAGPYDVVDFGDIPPNDIRKRPLALRGIAARGEGKNMSYALENTDGILSALEGYFGTEYPYEKLDLIAAPNYAFGAMENPGAIVYRESLLLLDDDAPLSQKRSYARVHSHELAHQWFGDLVTPVWWEDIWLNEAFATWMGNKATALWQPEGNFDNLTLNASLGAMNIDTLSTTRKVREPLERSENVMDQFDGITYRKGGGVLSMFESFVGEAAFRDGVRLHMERYKDGVATGDDFFESIADGSKNADVVSAMKSFVDQPGLPIVSGELMCTSGQTSVTLSQSRYAPLGSKTKQGQTWEIPVCANFGFGDTKEKACTLMKDKTATLTPKTLGCADWMTPNQNGAGYYRFSLDSDGWSRLFSHMDKLNTREVLAMQDSLTAAYRAGQVDSTVLISGMEKFAAYEEYSVASKASNLLSFIYDDIPEARDDLAPLVRNMYAKRYKDNVGKDTVDGNLLVPSLAGDLMSFGQDTVLEAEFAKNGAAYLGLSGEPNKKAVRTNVLGTSLRAAMKAHGEASYAPLLALTQKGNPLEKSAAISALAATKDPAIADRVRALALDEDSPLTGRQSNSLVYSLLGSEGEGEKTWDWLKANFDDYVKRKVPDVRVGGMPGYAGSFCSLERRDEVEAFFESKAAVIPGYERSLAQTLEGIELCAALKDAKAEELKAALKTR